MFNYITVNFDRTQRGIYIIYNFIRNSLYHLQNNNILTMNVDKGD